MSMILASPAAGQAPLAGLSPAVTESPVPTAPLCRAMPDLCARTMALYQQQCMSSDNQDKTTPEDYERRGAVMRCIASKPSEETAAREYRSIDPNGRLVGEELMLAYALLKSCSSRSTTRASTRAPSGQCTPMRTQPTLSCLPPGEPLTSGPPAAMRITTGPAPHTPGRLPLQGIERSASALHAAQHFLAVAPLSPPAGGGDTDSTTTGIPGARRQPSSMELLQVGINGAAQPGGVPRPRRKQGEPIRPSHSSLSDSPIPEGRPAHHGTHTAIIRVKAEPTSAVVTRQQQGNSKAAPPRVSHPSSQGSGDSSSTPSRASRQSHRRGGTDTDDYSHYEHPRREQRMEPYVGSSNPPPVHNPPAAVEPAVPKAKCQSLRGNAPQYGKLLGIQHFEDWYVKWRGFLAQNCYKYCDDFDRVYLVLMSCFTDCYQVRDAARAYQRSLEDLPDHLLQKCHILGLIAAVKAVSRQGLGNNRALLTACRQEPHESVSAYVVRHVYLWDQAGGTDNMSVTEHARSFCKGLSSQGDRDAARTTSSHRTTGS